MPTIHKPQLDHRGFNWREDAERLHQALLERADAILCAIGLRNKPRHPAQPGQDLSEEESELLRQCAGAISEAAAIQLDAGYKPVNKLIATLGEIEKNPSIVFERSIEPEALAVLASWYRRGDEPPGMFWCDIYGDDGASVPNPQNIRDAATWGILFLGRETTKGRPKNIAMEVLASRLVSLYMGFNDRASRRSVVSWSRGRYVQIEDGPFVDFLKLVIAPLNQFYAEQPGKDRPTPISAPQLARIALRDRSLERDGGNLQRLI